MDVVSNKKEMIFKSEKDGKVFYSIGMPYKDKNGDYKNEYMPCRFKKDVNLDNKTRIIIKQAWLSSYEGFKYVFINDFEIADYVKEQPKEEGKENKSIDNWDSAKDIEIDPDELPFY